MDDMLARAHKVFDEQGMRLTPLRERVLKVIAGSHHAIGAYDVLDRLNAEGERLTPISIYRAIEALVAAGVIHRLESRNAFFACHARHRAGGAPVVLACEACGTIAEIADPGITREIEQAAAKSGFAPRSIVIELAGQCGRCRAEGRKP
jgi:Fur family zinc uptake transcriptional regulator